jgi:chemosensory pili system protein ChpC
MERIPCLLLPIQNRTLMLPYNTVAEVVTFQNPEQFHFSQEWLGSFLWHGLTIPLICLERINQIQKSTDVNSSLFIAVLNRSSEHAPDFIGLILQGYPKMDRFSKSEVEWVSHSQDPYLLMEVLAKKKAAFIPNLSWIEETIMKRLRDVKA